MLIIESCFDLCDVIYDVMLNVGDLWLYDLKCGQIFCIFDLEGNQVVDMLFYCIDDFEECYSVQDMICVQCNLYLSVGSVFVLNYGNLMVMIVVDMCGCYDMFGGVCVVESNMVCYVFDKCYMYNCCDSFFNVIVYCMCGVGVWFIKCDLVGNVNFFMNVFVMLFGGFMFEDGIFVFGKYVEMCVEMDVMVLILNCL